MSQKRSKGHDVEREKERKRKRRTKRDREIEKGEENETEGGSPPAQGPGVQKTTLGLVLHKLHVHMRHGVPCCCRDMEGTWREHECNPRDHAGITKNVYFAF